MSRSRANSSTKPAAGSSTASIPCAYCDLPVRPRRTAEIDSDQPIYCCYGCRFAADITQARGEQGHATLILTRLGIAVFLSMSVMIFSLYLYSREAYFTEADHASSTADALTALMRYASFLFTGPVFVLLGFPLIESSIEQWRRGIASTDALVVLGVGSAFAFSAFHTFTGGEHSYFETVCMVLVLVTLGRWLEATAKLRASDATKSLSSLLPESVSVLREGEHVTIPIDELQAGDVIHAPAGARIVADGIIISGSAAVNESIVTGESRPRRRSQADAVIAGSTTVDGALHYRATAVGSASTIGRIESMLAEARREKSRYEKLADRVASWFLPLTICAAVLVALVSAWWWNLETGVLRGLAMLLIACPCALGIATPTAVWAALGRAARMGALFTNGDALERLGRIEAICFDKTGTLTTDIAIVESATAVEADELDTSVAVAAGLAASSRHVVAQSITHYAEQLGIEPMQITDAQTIAGKGVTAYWNGTRVYLGSPAFMSTSNMQFEPELETQLAVAREDGSSICCVGWAGSVHCVFALTESIRPSATPAIVALNRQGIKPIVLTGDHERRGQQLATQLNIDVRAELLPQDKTAALTDIRNRLGTVAMVGDGINDSPALATADVGIALACGADLARDAADVCLLGNDLRLVPNLVELSRQTIRTIRVNLFWAFAFNIVGITLAAAGQLTPIFAAIAMVISSLLVVGNSLRLAAIEDCETFDDENNTEASDTIPDNSQCETAYADAVAVTDGHINSDVRANKLETPTPHTLAQANPKSTSRSDGAVAPVCNRWGPPTHTSSSLNQKQPTDANVVRATL